MSPLAATTRCRPAPSPSCTTAALNPGASVRPSLSAANAGATSTIVASAAVRLTTRVKLDVRMWVPRCPCCQPGEARPGPAERRPGPLAGAEYCGRLRGSATESVRLSPLASDISDALANGFRYVHYSAPAPQTFSSQTNTQRVPQCPWSIL